MPRSASISCGSSVGLRPKAARSCCRVGKSASAPAPAPVCSRAARQAPTPGAGTLHRRVWGGGPGV
jgi:hypothetical protein